MSKQSIRPLVLLLEDEAIIALDLQDELQEAGFAVAGPFRTCASALEWLRTGTPDTAILDTVLKDGPCRDIAMELDRRGVPFIIYSGHREDSDHFGEFPHVTWLEKPVPPSVLVEACSHLLATTA
jgi:DNA-binding response OmpR family regulator